MSNIKTIVTAMNYAIEKEMSVHEFIDVLKRSTLSERRPIDDYARIKSMIGHADIVATARNSDGLLVGISRAISDFACCTYLSDLAVDQAYQKQGIGKKLIDLTHEAAGLQTRLLLHAAPAAEQYYPHIGMDAYPNCWTIPGKK